jgi:CRISPR-associated protein Cas1
LDVDYAFLGLLQDGRSVAQKPRWSAKLLSATCRTLTAFSGTPSQETLRGIEGAAARGYFQSPVAAFPASLAFRRRVRRPPTDPVNACLSLAYTLLLFEAVTAAHTAGLDPALGCQHVPLFGRPSLACDLIEPLRPQADLWVWSLFHNRVLRPEHFHCESASCRLGKAGRGYFYEAYEQLSNTTRRQLRRYAALAVHAIRSQPSLPIGEPESELDDEFTPEPFPPAPELPLP